MFPLCVSSLLECLGLVCCRAGLRPNSIQRGFVREPHNTLAPSHLCQLYLVFTGWMGLQDSRKHSKEGTGVYPISGLILNCRCLQDNLPGCPGDLPQHPSPYNCNGTHCQGVLPVSGHLTPYNNPWGDTPIWPTASAKEFTGTAYAVDGQLLYVAHSRGYTQALYVVYFWYANRV